MTLNMIGRLVSSLILFNMFLLIVFNYLSFGVLIQWWWIRHCCFPHRCHTTVLYLLLASLKLWCLIIRYFISHNRLHVEERCYDDLIAIIFLTRCIITTFFLARRTEPRLFNYGWALHQRIAHSFLTCRTIHRACSLRILESLGSRTTIWWSIISILVL